MEMRSFLAFELPEEIKGIVSRVSNEMKKSPLDIRWTRVDNIHLTIIFMGNINTDRLGSMDKVVRDVCRDHGPFHISLKSAGVFSSRRSPKVLWIGLAGDMERMSLFKNALEKNLGPFGIQEEKRQFNPHLTLGRFRKDAKSGPHLDALLQKYRDLTSPVHTLSELVLFKSDLKPSGAVYTKLNAWPLAGNL